MRIEAVLRARCRKRVSEPGPRGKHVTNTYMYRLVIGRGPPFSRKPVLLIANRDNLENIDWFNDPTCTTLLLLLAARQCYVTHLNLGPETGPYKWDEVFDHVPGLLRCCWKQRLAPKPPMKNKKCMRSAKSHGPIIILGLPNATKPPAEMRTTSGEGGRCGRGNM